MINSWATENENVEPSHIAKGTQMLRKDIAHATKKVMQALEASELKSMLEEFFTGQPDGELDRSKLLPVFINYMKLYDQFGEAEKRLISIMELDFLHNTDFWSMLMTGGEVRPQHIYPHLERLRFV